MKILDTLKACDYDMIGQITFRRSILRGTGRNESSRSLMSNRNTGEENPKNE